jgi:hypothetical protein
MLHNFEEILRTEEVELSTRKGDADDQRHLVGTTTSSIACTKVITEDNLMPSTSANKFQVLKRLAWTTTSGKQLKFPPKKNYPIRFWIQDMLDIFNKHRETVHISFILMARNIAAKALIKKHSPGF